jgi:hypothetical protein
MTKTITWHECFGGKNEKKVKKVYPAKTPAGRAAAKTGGVTAPVIQDLGYPLLS